MSRLLALVLLALSVTLPARPAHAINRDLQAVAIGGGYGILAGLGGGLIAFAVNQEPRSIGIGAAAGLYLGIAAGLYYIWDRSIPEDPSMALAPRPYDFMKPEKAKGRPGETPPPLAEVSFVLMSY